MQTDLNAVTFRVSLVDQLRSILSKDPWDPRGNPVARCIARTLKVPLTSVAVHYLFARIGSREIRLSVATSDLCDWLFQWNERKFPFQRPISFRYDPAEQQLIAA